MPCLPVAGPQMGQYVVPPVGAGVFTLRQPVDTRHQTSTGAATLGAPEVERLG